MTRIALILALMTAVAAPALASTNVEGSRLIFQASEDD
jgi:P pilus assembly chaperone PapD